MAYFKGFWLGYTIQFRKTLVFHVRHGGNERVRVILKKKFTEWNKRERERDRV